jgi:hypothetical protein
MKSRLTDTPLLVPLLTVTGYQAIPEQSADGAAAQPERLYKGAVVGNENALDIDGIKQ